MNCPSCQNIGPDTERQLEEVGITTAEALQTVGAQQAWLMLQTIDESACVNRLMGLEGAIQGVRRTQLSEERKAELKTFYQQHKLK